MIMKKKMSMIAVALGLFLAAGLVLPWTGAAGLPAPPLPPLFIPAPPSVVLIPGTYAYFAPDVDGDLLFSGGHWYRPYGGRWYVSDHYKGPWNFVAPRNVPAALMNLPHGYRSLSPGRERIPYGQLHNNWKTWERKKHWDASGRPGTPPKKLKKESVKRHESKGKHGDVVKDKAHGKEEKLGKEDKSKKRGNDKITGKQPAKHGSDKELERDEKR